MLENGRNVFLMLNEGQKCDHVNARSIVCWSDIVPIATPLPSSSRYCGRQMQLKCLMWPRFALSRSVSGNSSSSALEPLLAVCVFPTHLRTGAIYFLWNYFQRKTSRWYDGMILRVWPIDLYCYHIIVNAFLSGSNNRTLLSDTLIKLISHARRSLKMFIRGSSADVWYQKLVYVNKF